MDKIQSVVTEHGQRIESLESDVDLQDQRISKLEERVKLWPKATLG